MSKKIRNKKDIIIALAGALIILAILDLTPLGGNIAVYSKTLQCGNLPVQNGSVIVGEVPYYENTPGFSIFRGVKQYHCTPYEAEKAGYSADPKSYSFPHLSEDETQAAIQKSNELR